MGLEINLVNYQVRTDLAIEAIANIKSETGIKSHVEKQDDISITTVFIDENGSKGIGKPEGCYITIEFDDVTDHDNKEKVKKVFSEQLKEMLKFLKIKKDDLVLIVWTMVFAGCVH